MTTFSAPALRIVFAGTPDFAAASLRALLNAGFPPVAVYTQPDRPAGRGHKLQPSAVKRVALEANLPVEQPLNFKSPEALDRLASLRPDLMIVAAYGLILPQSVLQTPWLGCVNIHASLLPRWRGAAPIQRAIEAGDSQTGITLMQMDEGLDTGDMLMREAVDILPTDTGGTLHDKLAECGAAMIVQLVSRLARGEKLPATPQDEALATYARKISKADARLDWSEPAKRLERIIRAYHPWPVAWTPLGEQHIKIHAAQVIDTPAQASPGTVLARTPEGILVACGDGQLNITRLQRPGGKPLNVRDFINSGKPLLEPGSRLG